MTQNGVATQHMLPAALTQYGRHYGAQTMQSYSLPGNWVPQYVMQPAPHITQMEVSVMKSCIFVTRPFPAKYPTNPVVMVPWKIHHTSFFQPVRVVCIKVLVVFYLYFPSPSTFCMYYRLFST